MDRKFEIKLILNDVKKMSDRIQAYEQLIRETISRILSEIYPEGAFDFISQKIELSERNITTKILKASFDRMIENGFIHDNSTFSNDHTSVTIYTCLTELGIIEHENHDFSEGKLSREIIRLLEFVINSDDSQLTNDAIIKGMIEKGSNLNAEEIVNFVLLTFNLSIEIEKYVGKSFRIFNPLESITEIGKSILLDFEKWVGESNKPFFEKENFRNALSNELARSDLLILNENTQEGQKGIIFFANLSYVGKRAIKVYKTTLTAENQENLIHEAILLQKLSHPNLLEVFYHRKFEFEGEMILYLVEEFVNGKTIEWMLCNNILREISLNSRIQLFHQFISAMDYMRQNLEVHGDIHNENIMITIDNKILKIIDPGFSDYMEDKKDFITDDDRSAINYILTAFFDKSERKNNGLNKINEITKVPEILDFLESNFPAEFDQDNSINYISDQKQFSENVRWLNDNMRKKNWREVLDKFEIKSFRIYFKDIFKKIKRDIDSLILINNDYTCTISSDKCFLSSNIKDYPNSDSTEEHFAFVLSDFLNEIQKSFETLDINSIFEKKINEKLKRINRMRDAYS